jgi:tRNA (cytidine/uridine-2'-O-)-methyltransferase
MFRVVLYQPEIPPNTGNVIRLCANAGCQLHLIRPLGFALDDRRLRRAGLDYHEWVDVREHNSFSEFLGREAPQRLFGFTTSATIPYTQVVYQLGDALLFGPETRGLPRDILEQVLPQQRLRIPMRGGQRSLNLSNAVSVVVFEAWRQQGFHGAG